MPKARAGTTFPFNTLEHQMGGERVVVLVPFGRGCGMALRFGLGTL